MPHLFTMTRERARHLRSDRRRGRRFAAVTAGLAVVVGSVAVATGPVAAAPPSRIVGDRHSSAVVWSATAALDRYERYAISRHASLGYDQEVALMSGLRFADFEHARDAAAVVTARELGVDVKELRAAWRRTDVPHQVAVLAALGQVGTDYQSNTSEPGVGFDCSGLTAYAWGLAGYTLTRQSSAQISAAEPRDRESAMAGDLIQYPGHVMMYLGAGDAIVHAANHERDVELSFVPEGRSVSWGDPTA